MRSIVSICRKGAESAAPCPVDEKTKAASIRAVALARIAQAEAANTKQLCQAAEQMIGAMADAIKLIAAVEKNGVTRTSDLIGMGFVPAEIYIYYAEARLRVRSESESKNKSNTSGASNRDRLKSAANHIFAFISVGGICLAIAGWCVALT